MSLEVETEAVQVIGAAVLLGTSRASTDYPEPY